VPSCWILWLKCNLSTLLSTSFLCLFISKILTTQISTQ
jgi:hypothetical protein